MTDVAAPPPAANPPPEPRRQLACVPRERQPAGPRVGARPADPAPAHPAQHDRQRHRRPAHLRGRGNQERQRGLGRPADLRRPDDRPALPPRGRAGVRLPEALAREAHDRRPHRARAAPSRPVHGQRLQRHARRRGRIPDQPSCAPWRRTAVSTDWSAARLEVGLSDMRCHRGRHGRCRRTAGRLDALARAACCPRSRRSLGMLALDGRETVSVRFSLTLAGSGKLGLVPLGRRTEATLVVALAGAELHRPLCPSAQTVDKDGFRARWSASHLGRPYGQLWDSASCATTRRLTRS